MAVKMNELPVFVLLKILDSLPMKDAIRCRRVCKAWQGLIDQFVLDELNLFLYQRQYTEWFDLRKCSSHLNKSLSFTGRLVFVLLVVENEKFYCLFRNLKKLFFKQDSSRIEEGQKDHDLEKLINSLKSLEHLALEGTDLFSIRLEKLKTLDWSSGRDLHEDEVVLDCPELRALAIDWHNQKAPILKCPKLKHLKYANYRDWVAKLASLEVLNLGQLKTNSESFFRNHPKLHTLNLFHVEKTVVKELIRSKRELERADLRIFCRSLPVESRDVLNEFDQIFLGATEWFSFTAKSAEFYSKYEREFRDDFFLFGKESTFFVIRDKNFPDFKRMADRSSVLEKTHRVKQLTVQVGPDSFGQNELIELLKRMPHLNCLILWDVSYDQNFYDQLPSVLPFLYCLHINGNKNPLTDLLFILRFQELAEFLDRDHKYSSEDNRVRAEFSKMLDFGEW